MQKYVNLLDLVKSFPTSIYLQKSASIQPRTSPSKLGGKIQFNIHFTPRLLPPPPEFLVALLQPGSCDYLSLADNVRQVDVCEAGEWTMTRLNP